MRRGTPPPARLLVEIDEGLKRELKVKLLREGLTLKDWLTRSARAYLGSATRAVHSSPRPASFEPAPLHPQLGQVAPHLAHRLESPALPEAAPEPEPETEPEPIYTRFRPDDDYLD